MISFIDIILIEIRLTFLNENEIEYFINGTMQTNIRKNTLLNFKFIVSNCLWHGENLGQPNQCYIKTCPPRTNKIFKLKQEKHILRTSSLTFRIYINKVLYMYPVFQSFPILLTQVIVSCLFNAVVKAAWARLI